MATILEALQNADYNIRNNGMIGAKIGGEQLHNAVTLLEKGYPIHCEVEETILKYGDLDKVPDFD